MSAAEARQVLRTLLRAVDRSITPATGNRQWRQYVLAEFRRTDTEADPAERQRALQDARDFAFLINSVREHKARLKASSGGARLPPVAPLPAPTLVPASHSPVPGLCLCFRAGCMPLDRQVEVVHSCWNAQGMSRCCCCRVPLLHSLPATAATRCFSFCLHQR